MSGQYSIKIPVFEGPLDLLLHLIKKNEIDIYDIPISVITGQYLEYIEMMKELNLEIAGEFLVMAATLIQIKSRMLLPVEEQISAEEQEDPRLELVQRLLEYQAFKEASLALKEFGQRWSDALYREETLEETGEEECEDKDKSLSLFDISLFDLISAFQKILEKAPPELQNITREAISLNDSISKLLERLEEKDTLKFEELFPKGAAKANLIVTFVAILEILKLGLARVYQEEKFGPIWVIKTKDEPVEEGIAETEPAAALDEGITGEEFEFGSEDGPAAPEEISGEVEAFSDEKFAAADFAENSISAFVENTEDQEEDASVNDHEEPSF